MSVFGTGPAVAKIKDGTFADLILLGPPALNELAKAGKVDAATIMPAFNSRIGLAVRAGATKPDIGTDDALKKTLLDARSIGHSIGPSGDHFSKEIITRLGIADQVKPKITVVRGMPVAAAVAKGDVEIGIHQIAELMQVPGIDIVGELPAEHQQDHRLRHRADHHGQATRRRQGAGEIPRVAELRARHQEERHGPGVGVGTDPRRVIAWVLADPLLSARAGRVPAQRPRRRRALARVRGCSPPEPQD